MELKLKKIKNFYRRGNGMTNFVSSVSNGYLYTFSDADGKEYTKYSYHIWGTVCKYRTKLSDEIVNLQKEYLACGMVFQAKELEEIEIPYEGDVYNFEFTLKPSTKDEILRIKKNNL